MKLLALSLTALILGIGWGVDHAILSAEIKKSAKIYVDLKERLNNDSEAYDETSQKYLDAAHDLRNANSSLNEMTNQRDKSDSDFADEQHQNISLQDKLTALQKDCDKLQQINKGNYDAAVYWSQREEVWRTRTLDLIAQIKSQQGANSFTTSFNPDAISNPGAREAFANPSSTALASPPVQQVPMEDAFLPESSTTINPQTGEVEINEH